MKRTVETVRLLAGLHKLLAELHKTPPDHGSYFLRGELEEPRGRTRLRAGADG